MFVLEDAILLRSDIAQELSHAAKLTSALDPNAAFAVLSLTRNTVKPAA